MSRVVRAAVIQSKNVLDPATHPDPLAHRDANLARGLEQLEEAAAAGAQIACLQEIFTGPYFCAEQDDRWFELAEPVPGGPTLQAMSDAARRLQMVVVAPVFERVRAGVFYNTAAVFDDDGTFLGKYRKHHIPHCLPGFWEKYYFKPGTGGYPVFETAVGRVGVYICYDRHFPEGARALGLAGAEIVFNPSATTRGHSNYLWKLEQPAHAVANGYFIAANNRVGWEHPWDIGEFYGTSYLCDPRGRILAEGPADADAVVVADLDLSLIDEVRAQWAFFRDRRPETYGDLADSDQ
jgi:beta-ureidopropionase